MQGFKSWSVSSLDVRSSILIVGYTRGQTLSERLIKAKNKLILHIYMDSKAPIAIVGISVEIPSGSTSEFNLNHDTFFKFLIKKQQSYQRFPPDRFKIELVKGPNLGQTLTEVGSFLKDFSLFDAAEFGIPAKDAKAMAVGTRKLIEASFLALLDSGIAYRGRNVGSYMSAVSFDTIAIANADEYEPRGSFAGYPYMVANKVSYYLDLLGPSVPVDTACSSTMTALHLAVQALRWGDCEAAVVGGCQLNHRFLDFIQYSQGSVLAPDGKCKPFDISANGFSRGEGVGAIVLKPLEDAIRDGDYIYASILGTGINSTGSAAPVSAPVADAQMDAMYRAYAGTGRIPSDVDYIELHATGTAAGDPVEANWVGSKFCRADELLIGSVKGNIGHLEIMSFLASLSKVCSIFESGIIPPNVNLKTPNPAIRWKEFNMRAPTEPTPLHPRNPSGKALVSMTSSGIGGSNGHVLVEGPPTRDSFPETSHRELPSLLVAGGLSPRTATAIADSLTEMASSNPSCLGVISRIYGRRSRQMTWRSVAVCVPNLPNISFSSPRLSPRTKPPLAFVFSGQGPQHLQMGRQLFRDYPVFRQTIERLDCVYEAVVGTSLIKQTGLFTENDIAPSLPEIWSIAIIFPALCMLQLSLVDLLASIGIVPDIVIGHSAGEIPMTYASGAVSQTMALELSIARGVALSACEGTGAMAAVACNSTTATLLIREVLEHNPDGVLEISCYNAPEAVTLSGTRNLIEYAVVLAEARGIFARTLRTHFPAHSRLLDPGERDYRNRLNDVFGAHAGDWRPKIRTYSSFTGKLWDGPFMAEYFWWNTRNPVLFSDAVSALLKDAPKATFIEIGPHPVLESYLSTLGGPSHLVTALMRRTKTLEHFQESRVFLTAVGEIIVRGCDSVDFGALNVGTSSNGRITLSPYPFARKHISYYPESSQFLDRITRQRTGPLNGLHLGLNSLTHPVLAQHVISKEPIMPASGYLEMAFESGARYLWNVGFENIMPLLPDRILRVQVSTEGHQWSVRSWTSDDTADYRPTRLHAQGYMSPKIPQQISNILDLAEIRNRCKVLNMKGFYRRMSYFAQYGIAFQRVTACHISADGAEGLIRIRGSEDNLEDAGNYHFHPAVLDSCIHALVHQAFTRNMDESVYYLPASVESVALHTSFIRRALPHTLYAYVKLDQWSPDAIMWDLDVLNADGNKICTFIRLRLQLHRISIYSPLKNRFSLVYQRRGNQQHHKVEALPAVSVSDANEKNATVGIDHSLRSCLEAYRKIYETIVAADQKKVIHVLIICAGSSPVPIAVQEQIKHDPLELVYLDYTVATVANAEGLIPPQLIEHVRHVRFNPDHTDNEQLALCTFDVVVAFDICSYLEDPSAAVRYLVCLLQPGGHLLVGEGSKGKLMANSSQTPPGTTLGSVWHEVILNSGLAPRYTYTHPRFPHSFCVDAQKPSCPLLPWNSLLVGVPEQPVIHFDPGNVLQNQRIVEDLEDSPGSALWITATTDPDSASVLGFSRSLRREMHSATVYVVVFDPVWTPEKRLQIVRDLSGIPDLEKEVLIDRDGQIHVPRIVPRALTFMEQSSVDFDKHWIFDQDTVFQLPLPVVLVHHVLVRVTHLSFSVGGLRGFVGRVTDSGSTQWTNGASVVGVTEEVISNDILVHEGQIAATPVDAIDLPSCATRAVPLLVLATSIGIESLRNPSRFDDKKFLVTDADDPTGRWLAAILVRLGFSVATTPNGLNEVSLPTIRRYEYILSGFSSVDDAQMIRSKLHGDAVAISWNDPLTSQRIHRNPWIVRDILGEVHLLTLRTPLDGETVFPTPREHISLMQVDLKVHTALFDPQRPYLLIGGIGSLGLHIAWWMYQNGARQIILTSRSGEASLTRARNVPAIRLLGYLRNLPDLTLRLEVCDASSPSATATLVDRLATPLAGCMLLAVYFSDRLFTSHDHESFYAPFLPKDVAFRALEQAVSIPSLDFLVALSSVTGLFGSPGQTNYSGANTAVDALVRSYTNAFSMIAPAILDSDFLTNENDWAHDSRYKMWTTWGITSRQLCESLEDGIRAVYKGTGDHIYIPDVNWDEIQVRLGSSPMYAHFLIEQKQDMADGEMSSALHSVRQIVLNGLDVQITDFSPEIPFTSYGLDSLSAGPGWTRHGRTTHSRSRHIRMTGGTSAYTRHICNLCAGIGPIGGTLQSLAYMVNL